MGEIPKEIINYISLITKKLFKNNEINNKKSSFLFVKSLGVRYFSDYYEIIKYFSDNGFEYIQFNEFLLFFLRDGEFGRKFKIKNFLPKKKPNKIESKIIFCYNSLISFFFVKKHFPHLMELKKFDRTKSDDNYMCYEQFKDYLNKKNLLDDKYNFIDLINNDNN